jgi:hypothetical protein
MSRKNKLGGGEIILLHADLKAQTMVGRRGIQGVLIARRSAQKGFVLLLQCVLQPF